MSHEESTQRRVRLARVRYLRRELREALIVEDDAFWEDVVSFVLGGGRVAA